MQRECFSPTLYVDYDICLQVYVMLDTDFDDIEEVGLKDANIECPLIKILNDEVWHSNF